MVSRQGPFLAKMIEPIIAVDPRCSTLSTIACAPGTSRDHGCRGGSHHLVHDGEIARVVARRNEPSSASLVVCGEHRVVLLILSRIISRTPLTASVPSPGARPAPGS